MHDSLISSLSLLGVPQPLALRLAHHAGAAGMPLDGALARVSQLQFGVQNSIVSLHDATTMLSEQPECLRRDIRASLVTEAVVCVSKPYDMQMSLDKAGPRWPGEISVRDWLAAEHPETLTEDGEARLCHNLDFATSGVLIAAKSHVAAADVSRCFRDRLARKVYCALVFGHPSWEATQWDDRIMENGRRFKQRISGGGKAAQTDVVVGARGVLRVGQHAGREASLLWLFPHTGRRHQLRLHCSHHQHAIVGDATYAEDKLMYRMFLHAAALELPLERSDPLRVADPLQPHGWSHVFESGGSIHLPDGWSSEDLLGASSAVLGDGWSSEALLGASSAVLGDGWSSEALLGASSAVLGETVDGPKWAVAEAAEAAEGLTKVDGMRLMADKEAKAFTTKAFTMEAFTTKAFTMEGFLSMLTPGAVLAKAGLSGTTAAMLKPGVLVAKAGVTAP
ncbi:RNA pseudouridylate synthase domain-containing protein 1 [Chrysochromulina tobinii]|uniref:RNA pseudouridylate synthase domain-containing protein 1 n=1 Tax=Chrysochromulina tobinii TaxID=1460289 RepID=A0A0M0JGI3_9EUKA|nr:RNA pseudouridylate synthase domain-containing protein 1 [Chrysochromulina tobinii]|eukprot:KOO25353.1 RNA pseudouridylate synthase domain-containing protein 1 [Chrysochromulina sp. CCMP291]